jgi:WD40 repeat protein
MALTGHTSGISFLIELSDGRLCTASEDTTIKLWNSSSGECEATLVGHTRRITSIIEYSPTQLCTASLDRTIRLWDTKTFTSVIFKSDTAIDYLELLPNLELASLASSEGYGYLTFWNLNAQGMTCRFKIDNADGYTSCYMIQLASGDLCIYSNYRAEVSIWDFKTHQKVKSFQLPYFHPEVFCMTLLRDGRVSISMRSHDGAKAYTVYIYSTETWDCEQELPRAVANNMVQLNDGRLFYSPFADNVVVWT